MLTTYENTLQGRNVRSQLRIDDGRLIEIVTSLAQIPTMRTTATVWQVGADGKWRHRTGLSKAVDFNQVLLACAPPWAIQQLLNIVQACMFEQMPVVRDKIARHYAALPPRGPFDDEETFVVVRDPDGSIDAEPHRDADASTPGDER